jgi:hypothetical protein
MLGSNPKKEKPRSKSGKTIARDGVVPVNGKGEVSVTRFASIVFLPKGQGFSFIYGECHGHRGAE